MITEYLFSWLTKPHYLFTPLDSIVAVAELVLLVFLILFIQEWMRKR